MSKVTHVLSKAAEAASETRAEKKTKKVFDSPGDEGKFSAS
jgi:hypothetical protein